MNLRRKAACVLLSAVNTWAQVSYRIDTVAGQAVRSGEAATVTVTNAGTSAIAKPIFLVIDNLTSSTGAPVFLVGNQQITHCGSPNGIYLVPVTVVGGTLGAGQVGQELWCSLPRVPEPSAIRHAYSAERRTNRSVGCLQV